MPRELDALATPRPLREEAMGDRPRTHTAWFVAIAGGITVGGLLLFLFVTLSGIGPPKEPTRQPDVRTQSAPVEAARDSSRSGTAAQTKLADRRREAEKRAAEARELATVRQAKIVTGNELAERKEQAWQRFYKPSETCNEHRGTMACVNEYARAKMEFERRFSEGQL